MFAGYKLLRGTTVDFDLNYTRVNTVFKLNRPSNFKANGSVDLGPISARFFKRHAEVRRVLCGPIRHRWFRFYYWG